MTRKIPFENEYQLHILTQNNLKELFDLELIASEIQLNKLRLDNLAFDLKSNAFVIIEYKNEFDANVLNQAQKYYDLLQENKEFFLDRLDDAYSVDFENTKVMIIGPKFSDEQIKETKPNFELWKISLFDNGKVTYENLTTNDVKTLYVNLDELKLTEEILLKNKSEEMIDLYHNLKNGIMEEFGDVTVHFQVNQFSFRVNDNIICVVVFLKSSFNIFIYGKDLEDVERTTNISEKSTGGNTDYNLKYKSDDDFDYFLNLFRQTYSQKV